MSIYWAGSADPLFRFKIGEQGYLENFVSISPTGISRQKILPMVCSEGRVYASDVWALRLKRSFFDEGTMKYEIPYWKALEVDEIDDFQMIDAITIYKELE